MAWGKSIRVQGRDFRKIRHVLKFVSYVESDNGNIRANMVNKNTGRRYHKWLNPEEQQKFRNSDKYNEGFLSKGRVGKL